MSSFVPVEPRFITWKCPKCGYKTIMAAPKNPWIMTALPSFGMFGKAETPTCPKCGTTMKRS